MNDPLDPVDPLPPLEPLEEIEDQTEDQTESETGTEESTEEEETYIIECQAAGCTYRSQVKESDLSDLVVDLPGHEHTVYTVYRPGKLGY